MAKKKKTSTASSFKEAIGIDKIFHNERLNFFLGFLLLLVSCYMIWAFISYLTTGAADQSMIEEPREGEVLNQNGEFQNACGSMGAYCAWFFVKRCFGLSAFLIPVFLLLVSVNLMRAYKVNLLKWFLGIAIVTIWLSVTMAKFATPFFTDAHFNPGGDHGLAICETIQGLLGAPGLTFLLGITAIAFLIYLSAETIFIIRKIFNPLRYLKKIPMEINIGKGDTEESKQEIETLEDPTVFDDPQEQVVEFGPENDIPEEKEPQHVSVVEKKDTVMADDIIPSIEDETGVEMTVDTGMKEETADGKDLVGDYGDISTPYDPKRDLENYHYPTLDLLKKYDNDGKPYIDMAEQTANKNRIVDVLRNFGVEISSIKATVAWKYQVLRQRWAPPLPFMKSPLLLACVFLRSAH